MKGLQVLIFVVLSVTAFGKTFKDGSIEPRGGPNEPRGETYIPPPKSIKPLKSLERAATPSCNGPAVDLTGTTISTPVVLNSQNYPSNYVNNINCKFNFIIPANMEAVIAVNSYSLECPYDLVQIGYGTSPPVASMCSATASSYALGASSVSYSMYIQFTTDSTITYPGFSLNIFLRSATLATTSSPLTTKPPGTCTCGRFTATREEEKDDIDRIVGGFTARPHAYPYQVGLLKNDQVFCGGTLISPNYVLTAAHCSVKTIASQVKASVGDHDYTITGDGETKIGIANILVHPQYNPDNAEENDFAIWRLSSPAPMNSYVGIACLALDTTQTFAGSNLTISGWGTIASGGVQPPALKAAFILGMSNADCQKTGYPPAEITNVKLCGYTPSYNTDTCQGDSGGPLVANVNGKVTVVGVTSYGIGCAEPNYPGVYARVTAVKDWILANSDAGSCQN